MSLKFEKILPNKTQINALYLILKNRNYSISHKFLPNFEEHESFVKQNPYIAWYLIQKENLFIGNVYLNNDNSIGINLVNDFKDSDLVEIIGFIKKNHKPLPPIKSIRRDEFFINVPSSNKHLIKTLKDLNKKEIQLTFLV